MRRAGVAVLLFLLSSAVMAQLQPGVVVRNGDAFPIIADFNADGLDDLIQERNAVINDGATLSDVRDFELPELERVVGVLDVNGDHVLDLITRETPLMAPPSLGQPDGSRFPHYRLYIGTAARTYATSIDIPAGAYPYIADVNADHKDDIVLMTPIFEGVRTVATEVTVLRSRGDGTFDKLAPFRIAPDAQSDDYRLLSTDLNHDGIPDYVIRCPYDLVVLIGTGGGGFTVQDHYIPMDLNYGWWSTRLADVDGDTNPDVVMAGFRNIRVLFSDGHGNFTRSTIATIPKLHDVQGVPEGVPLDVDHMNQPRDLAIGHFTQGDRIQIAAGMGEGDVVIFSYDNGALKEVSRTRTEFLMPTIRPGQFRAGGGTDLYAMGTLIWGDMFPRPRVFYGSERMTIAATPARQPARRRVLRSAAASTVLTVKISGDCVETTTERWSFVREGIFGVAQTGQTKVEGLFDGNLIYFRLNAAFTSTPGLGVLAESNGVYTGTAGVMTACGWKTMSITATMN
jgi:VCBS repeat protein